MSKVRSYCSYEDVANFAGFHPSDMEDLVGAEMSLEEFQKYINVLIKASSNLVNRYCNVDTFFKHEIVDEYHSMNSSDMYSNTYGIWRQFSYYADYCVDSEVEHVSTIYPREQPVRNIAKVEINLAQVIGKGPKWVKLEEWGKEYVDEEGNPHIGKDYQVISRFDTTAFRLIYRFPAYGPNNLRVTYSAGYDDGSEELEAIRVATAMVVVNFLMYKKKNQEVSTIRGAGISDYAPMFESLTNGYIITPSVKAILDMYRRQPLDPSMYE